MNEKTINVYCEYYDGDNVCLEVDGDPRNEWGRLSWNDAMSMLKNIINDFFNEKLMGSFLYEPISRDNSNVEVNRLAIYLSDSGETLKCKINGIGKLIYCNFELSEDIKYILDERNANTKAIGI